MALKSEPKTAKDNEQSALVTAAAAAVLPVSELNPANREALCRSASVVHVQRNDHLRPENTHRWLMYLVEGSLTLYSGKNEVGQIAAGAPEALQPLFLDKGAYQSARTGTVARIVKFGREQLDILLREQQKSAIRVIDVEVGELENLVFDDVVADMRANRVHLASPADTVDRILAATKRVAGIPELAEVIQLDPGLTAHIVDASNRVEAATADSTTSIRGAISRLGVETTQRTIAKLLRTNTLSPSGEVLENRFRRYIQRSTMSAAIVQVLARDLPGLKPETASLIALSSDIGELLTLTYANAHAEHFKSEDQLAAVVEKLRTVLSYWLLNTWNFPKSFIETSLASRDWYRNHGGEITYADLVTAALLIIQAEIPDSAQSAMPSADNLLLARRLQQVGIDLKSPGDIVRAATGRIVTVQSLLKAS